jgi:hypothetical protein
MLRRQHLYHESMIARSVELEQTQKQTGDGERRGIEYHGNQLWP